MAQEPAVPVDRTIFDQLWFEHYRLREDFDRLLSCLGDTICRSSWQFHKEKFRAACRRDPLGPNGPSLQDALTTKTVRIVQQHLCGGREEMSALKKVSTSFKACADSILMDYGIYVCGGLDGHSGAPMRSAACFHTHDQVWEALPPPLVSVAGSAGALLDGCFYVCGNFGELGMAAMRFVIASRKWEQLPSMNKRRAVPSAAIAGGHLYVCGGEDTPEEEVHDSVEIFDALAPNPRFAHRAGVWRLLPAPMSARRRNFGATAVGGGGRQALARSCATVAVAAGRLLVLGGRRTALREAPGERAVQRFDPATGAWEVLPWELVHARANFCAAAAWRGALAA